MAKDLRKDPRVALSLLGRGKDDMGLQEDLVVYGKARITEGGAAELLQRLARTYLGPDVEFPPEPLRSKPGFIAHIRPERYAGIGPLAAPATLGGWYDHDRHLRHARDRNPRRLG
jgi:hypothetical protein